MGGGRPNLDGATKGQQLVRVVALGSDGRRIGPIDPTVDENLLRRSSECCRYDKNADQWQQPPPDLNGQPGRGTCFVLRVQPHVLHLPTHLGPLPQMTQSRPTTTQPTPTCGPDSRLSRNKAANCVGLSSIRPIDAWLGCCRPPSRR